MPLVKSHCIRAMANLIRIFTGIAEDAKFLHVLFMLRFYSPVNPLGSCRVQSVCLTTLFLGRLSPLNGKQVLAHILSHETDNCSSWISWRERMTVENISWSWSISTKECCRTRQGSKPATSWSPVACASDWATEAGLLHVNNKDSNKAAWMCRLIWIFTGHIIYPKVHFPTLHLILSKHACPALYFFFPINDIGLDKSGYQLNIFSYFPKKTYVVGTH